MNEEYEAARRDPALRQSFLETVDMEEYEPFIEGIYWKPNRKGMDNILEINPGVNDERKTIIHATTYAFRNFGWSEFYNVIVHHEGVHARQNYLGKSAGLDLMIEIEFNGDGKKLIMGKKYVLDEIEAHENQIAHSSFNKCSQEFRDTTINWLSLYEALKLEFDMMSQ